MSSSPFSAATWPERFPPSLVVDSLEGWALALKPANPAYVEYKLPEEAMGMGIIEGSRGALGHWIGD